VVCCVVIFGAMPVFAQEAADDPVGFDAGSAEPIRQIPEISFVLSDIQLRGDDTGLDLLHRISAQRSDLAVGLMTSLPPADPLHQLARDSFRVLAKPFVPADLATFVRNCTLAIPRAAQ